MNQLKKILKISGITLGFVVFTILLAGILFLNLSPQFGGRASDIQTEGYKQSKNYAEGKFINQIPTSMDMEFKEMIKVLLEFARNDPGRQPQQPLPIVKLDSSAIVKKTSAVTRLTWFGHSAFLLEIGGKNILLDPMLGDSPSPLPVLGSKRYSKELPIDPAQLPPIDAVIISHDHYDHLDYGTIKQIKDKVHMFYAPLGVGAHLAAWGVPQEKIKEMDWWQSTTYADLTIRSTPARHFSGRGLTDRNTTLWSSWIIESPNHKVFFSGDGGYGPHFKEIGDKYGPFDMALLECGQYDVRWKDIHMLPEQTAQAAIDVNTRLMMPIHWGAFTLALHDWTDPVRRVTAKAHELKMPIAVPRIGEVMQVGQPVLQTSSWWEL